MRTGLIVSIVVVALILIGGGTAALMLIDHPAPRTQVTTPTTKPVAGDPYSALVPCARLTSPPFAFDPKDEPTASDNRTVSVCLGTFGAHRVTVAMTLYSGPDAEASAVQGSLPWSSDKGFQRLNGTGFENAPFTGYNGDYGPLCTTIYRRHNIDVRIDFPDLPHVADTATCTGAMMPYVKQLYALIG